MPAITVPAVRRTLVRALALLAALTWAVLPGFGLADIGVTVRLSDGWRPVAGLEAGWGVLALVLAATFVRIAVSPRRCSPLLLVCSAPVPALVLAAVLGAEPEMWMFVAILVVEVAAVGAAAGAWPWQVDLRASRPLLGVLAVAAVPVALYSARMLAANRAGEQPVDITMGVDHWALQAGSALGLLLVVAVAALVPDVRVWAAGCAAAAVAWVAVVSLRAPDSAGALPGVAAVAALLWCGALLAVVAAAVAVSRPTAQPQVAGTSQT